MKRLAFVGVLAALFAGPALAQSFPSKDVRFLNGLPPGGTSDLLGRLLAEQFSKQLGKSVVVENKAGAGGMIAAAEAAKAAPDGHTILLASMALYPERSHLVGVYPLGKCQRVIALLRAALGLPPITPSM